MRRVLASAEWHNSTIRSVDHATNYLCPVAAAGGDRTQMVTPKNGKTFRRGETARLPEEHGKPAFLAREASRFIGVHKDNPFMLYVNFLKKL